jgi:hypothetical protein
LTATAVTVPEVAKSAAAVEALCTVPLALTVETTSPWVTLTTRVSFEVLGVLASEAQTSW